MGYGDFFKHRDPAAVCSSWCSKSLIQKQEPITYFFSILIFNFL